MKFGYLIIYFSISVKSLNDSDTKADIHCSPNNNVTSRYMYIHYSCTISMAMHKALVTIRNVIMLWLDKANKLLLAVIKLEVVFAYYAIGHNRHKNTSSIMLA